MMLTQSASLISDSTLWARISTSSLCAWMDTLPLAAISFMPALCTNRLKVFAMLAKTLSPLASDICLLLVSATWSLAAR
ncbi:hypothetical protein D3C81_1717550 [compost metagenome]